MSATSNQPVALDGRPLGRRGQITRVRILAATRTLLEEGGLRDLRVVEITRMIGVSPATFYQYFPDVESAVEALALQAGEDLWTITFELDRDWSGSEGLSASRALVEGFITYWDDHRAVLRTRNLAAQEGDQRFRAIRHDSLRPLLSGIERQLRRSRDDGAIASEIEPAIAAASLVAMLERVAAFHRDLETDSISHSVVIETVARLLHQAITGGDLR